MANQDNKQIQTGDFMKIQDLLYLCISKWYWFVISLILAGGIAYLYILKTPPVYTRTSTLLIKDEYSGESSLSGEIGSSFASMGLVNQRTNVFNEMVSLQSPSLMIDVAKRLHLDVSYSTEGRFYNTSLYGKTQPITVTFLDADKDYSASLSVKIIDSKRITFSEFAKGEDAFETELEGCFGKEINTPIGRILVTPTAHFSLENDAPIIVTKSTLYDAGMAYSGGLTVELNDDMSAVVLMKYKDQNPERAEEIMNTLIQVYNEMWIEDKNKVAVSTSAFIDERLAVIERELGNVDENISSFKSEHLLPDVQAASGMYLEKSNETNNELLRLNTQLSIAQNVNNYVTNKSNKNQLLPSNAGVENQTIENQIASYNTLLLQRNSLVANSSDQNPIAIDLDAQLNAMRGAIITTLNNYIISINTKIKSLEKSERQTTEKLAASPEHAKYLLSVERQQKVKESLYLYLLQKREENELSQAFTAYRTRIIMPPFGSSTPTTPVRRNIYAIAMVLGIFIPLVSLFIIENMNNKIRGRSDLEHLPIPFIGEIPMVLEKKHKFTLPSFFHKKQVYTNLGVVVKDKNRNIVNEAFRVVRTNLEFMIKASDKANVIIVTSANPGSGKTFITANLASSLAIKGKRVLAIDLDMRKIALSKVFGSPNVGISSYLIGKVSLDEIILKGIENPNLDVIPVGKIPPNPTELLFEPSLKELIESMKDKYDYIFIDCPPVEVVADTQIINKFADNTLFVVRAELLDKSMLPTIDRFYTEKKYNNMGIILNGTYLSRTGRAGYSYRYGYNYGYGDSYSYSSEI